MDNRSEKDFYATVVITSTKLTAAQIQNVLGLEGDELHEAGTQLSQRPGSKPFLQAVWKRRSALGEKQSIEKHVIELLALLETRSSAILSLRHDCLVEMWCFVSFEESQCGFAFEHELMRRLADLHCDLVFDIYH